MSQSTIFQSCLDGATALWVLPVLSGSKVSCSRHNTVEEGFGRTKKKVSGNVIGRYMCILFYNTAFLLCNDQFECKISSWG